MIIQFKLYTVHLALDLKFDAATVSIWFDVMVVLRGNIKCAFSRPNFVERPVPLADQYPTRRFCVMCSAY